MRAPGSRRGVVYIAVLIIAMVGLIGGVAYHQMMQAGRRAAYRSLTGEYAAMMSRTGLALAQGYLARAARDTGSELYKTLTKPAADLAAGTGPVQIGGEIDLADEFPLLVEAAAKDLPDGANSLNRLTAQFYLLPAEIKPLPALPFGDKSIERAGPEKSGKLHVEVTAEVMFALLGRGVERRVRASQEFRVAHAPVPLLSDFTLWLQKVPPPAGTDQRSPVNAVDASEKGIAPGNSGVPVILNNGVTGVQSTLPPKMDRKFFQEQGWVFLGGGDVTLNLTYSQDETAGDRSVGEDFHFYQYNPSNKRAGRATVDREQKDRANRHLGTPFWEIRNWDMGVNTLHGGALKEDYEDVFEGVPEGSRAGSHLKLFGAAPDRVSPTVVFGDVRAGFLRIVVAAAANNANGAFDAHYAVLMHKPKNASGFLSGFFSQLLKYIGKLLFVDDPKLSGKWVYYKPDVSGLLLPVGGGASEQDYKELCSGYRTRAYNVGLLHLKGKNQLADPRPMAAQLGLPEGLVTDSGTATDRNALPAELLPNELLSVSGLDLSTVDLTKLAEPLAQASCLKLPADRSLADALTERGMLANGVLDLGTTVLSEAAVTIPAITEIKRGGVILAKEIKLEGGIAAGPAITASDPQRRLVLISTTGPLTLPLDQRVDASLVALKGAVVPQGDFDVSGNIAAAKMDFAPLSGNPGAADLKFDAGLKERAPAAATAGHLLIDWSRRWKRLD